MSRIRVLPDNLVNQIAAGEVIERPASVVKELLENALDAGARAISIEIEGGGRRRIRVSDDGEGLERDDAVMAFDRHATSKLAAGDDLRRIATLGFRGEALPAIASVARVTLLTSRDGVSGTRVEIEAGRLRRVEEAGHPRGTTLDVRDLFFNTPARAKFLRSSETELGHISDLVAAYAVTVPSVRLKLAHEGRRLIEAAPAPDAQHRIHQVFGPRWFGAIPFEAARGPLTVRGLIAPPEAAGSSRRVQHIYVNGRLVKDRLVGHAVASACAEFLPKDRHAALFLFIQCPVEAVDVNVHPAKAEVRFADGRGVHDLARAAILGALRGALPITPMRAAVAAVGAEEVALSTGKTGASDPVALHESTLHYLEGAHSIPAASRPDWSPRPREIGAGAAALGHYRESYIVAADDEGLLLIDQHAAHERILFDGLVRQAASGRPEEATQALMFPITVIPPRAIADRADVVSRSLASLGFEAEPFGDGTLLVRSAPSLVQAAALPGLVEELLELMVLEDEEQSTGPGLERIRQRSLATIACHAAVKVRMPLTFEKMNYLINELFRTSAPLKCPHGRPAVLRWQHADIERGFDRR